MCCGSSVCTLICKILVCMYGTLKTRLLVTAPTHVQVLEQYWKDWKMNKAIFGGFVKFRFSDNKEVQGMLSSQFGEGWKASLEADRVRGWAGVRRLLCDLVLCDLVSCDRHVTVM